MSAKEYVVPDEMIEAAWFAQGMLNRKEIERVLEAAFRRLAEDPIVPSPNQARTILENIYNPPFVYGRTGCGAPGSDVTVVREQLRNNYCPEQRIFAEWIRIMFLKPEPKKKDNADRLIQNMRGYTFTLDEAAKLKEHIEMSTYAPVKTASFIECDTCRSKPGSPPLCRGCLHNRELIDSLNRR